VVLPKIGANRVSASRVRVRNILWAGVLDVAGFDAMSSKNQKARPETLVKTTMATTAFKQFSPFVFNDKAFKVRQ
jgi:hypothetical protein